MGNLVNISAAIADVMRGVIVDGVGFTDIQEYPTLEFTGFPAVTIAPSDNDSDYASTVENLRTYAFYVDCYYPIEDPTSSNGYATAFANMRQLIDVVLDAIDNSNSLNGTAQIVKPAPSFWQVMETEASVVLTARINLKTKVTSFTNNG
jgi:hypothetical protein